MQVYDINVLLRERGEWLYSEYASHCKVKTVKPESEWLYCFELKGVVRVGLHVEKRNGSLQISFSEFSGNVHVDVFAFGKPIFRNFGGPERRGLGSSLIVQIPAPKPEVPVPPEVVPPEIPPTIPEPTPAQEPITVRLDVLIRQLYDYEAKLDRILASMPLRANTYSVVTIDLGMERSSLVQFPIGGFAMTVFSNTGTFDLKLGDKTTDVITISPLTYPAMLTFDRVEFDKFFVRNTAQAGRQAVLIVWRRE